MFILEKYQIEARLKMSAYYICLNFKCAVEGHCSPTMQCTKKTEEVQYTYSCSTEQRIANGGVKTDFFFAVSLRLPQLKNMDELIKKKYCNVP